MNPLKKPNSFEEKLKKQLEASEWKPSDALWDKIEQNIQANSFEPKLQEKLSDFTVKPSEDFWDKLEPQLPESHRKRGLIWFSIFALITFSSFSIGYWFNTKLEKEQNAQLTQVVNKPAPQLEISPAKDLNTSLSVPQKIEKTASVTALQNTEKGLAKTSANQLSETKNTPQVAQDLVQAETNKASSIFKARSGKANNRKLKANAIASNEIPLVRMAETNQEPISAQQTIVQLQGKSDLNILVSDSAQEMKAPNYEPKEILSTKNLSVSAKDTFAENAPIRGNLYMEPEEVLTSFSLTAMAGMHYSMMTIAMPQSSRYNLEKSYQLRNSMENAAIDFSGALLVDYQLNKAWMVSLGIGITSFTQTLQFNVTSANQTNPDRVQPANLYMHSSDSIITGKSNSLENKYSFTEIPIQLTYLFKSDGNFQFGLGGGFSYGRLNLVNAYQTDPSCIGLLLVNDKNAFPKFRDVFFASFSPSVAMRINSSAAIGLMPQFKMALHSMVDNPDWIQQRPSLIGLNLFLRKRF